MGERSSYLARYMVTQIAIDKVLHYKSITKKTVGCFFVVNRYYFVANKNKSSLCQRAFMKNI